MFKLPASVSLWFKIGFTLNKILGIYPWYNIEKNEISHRKMNRIYIAVFSSLLLGFLIPVEFHASKDNDNIENILSSLNLIILSIITGLVVFGATFFKENSWKIYISIFMENLTLLSREMDFYKTCAKRFLIGNVVFIVTIFFVVYGILSLEEDYWFYITIPTIVLEYYCFQVTLTLITITSGISCIYEHLTKTLEQITISPFLSSFNNLDTDKMLIGHIVKVERQYIRTGELVQCFNEVEGFKFILIFWRSFIEMLRTVNFMLFLFSTKSTEAIPKETLVAIFVFTSFILVSIISNKLYNIRGTTTKWLINPCVLRITRSCSYYK